MLRGEHTNVTQRMEVQVGRAEKRFEGVSAGRRRNMQANRSKDTKPEVLVRRYLHAAGIRFRLHLRNLPGTPDLTLRSYGSVVEVRGCFWHGHDCALGNIPRSRQDYWAPKLAATRERDRRHVRALQEEGWQVIELWECDLRRRPRLHYRG